jgi:hypothetical protein
MKNRSIKVKVYNRGINLSNTVNESPYDPNSYVTISEQLREERENQYALNNLHNYKYA